MKTFLKVVSTVGACTLAFAAVAETPKPVIHWTFDDVNAFTNCGTGGVCADATIDGTSITYTNGVVGGALVLDKTKNNRVYTGYTPGEKGTISFWFRPESIYNYNSLFNNTTHADKWECWLPLGEDVGIRLNDKATYSLKNLNSTNAWCHLAFTYEKFTDAEGAAKVKTDFYLDGVRRTGFAGEDWYEPGVLLIGGGGDKNGKNANTFADLFLDEVRIYDEALTADQIQDVYKKDAAHTPVIHITLDEDTRNLGLNGERFSATLHGDDANPNFWTNSVLLGTKGFYLDQTTNYVAVPYRVSTSHSGTISLWYETYGEPYNYNSVFDNSKGGNDFELYWRGNSTMGFLATTAVKLELGEGIVGRFYKIPHHIVTTWDYAVSNGCYTYKIYMDGIELGTIVSNNVSGVMGGDQFFIGGGHKDNTPAYGCASDLRIYNCAISHGQVKKIYEDGISRRYANAVNLTAHVPFDNSIRDVTNAHEVVMSGEATFVADDDRKGLKAALDLDGSGYVRIKNVYAGNAKTNGTWAVWIKPRRPANVDQPHMNLCDNDVHNQYWESWVDFASMALLARVNDGATTVHSKKLAFDTWYHIAFTWDRGIEKLQLFVDGELTSEAHIPASLWVEPRPDFNLGTAMGGNNKFQGLVDDFRFYDRVLLPSEVAALAEIPELRYTNTILIIR